jgi:hypothetical protein
MNIRRGLNRLFIVAWIVYATCFAWYAYNVQVDSDLEWQSLRWKSCLQQAGPVMQQCGEEHERRVQQIFRDRDTRIRSASWIGMVLFMMVVPPLVFYGIALALTKVGGWVAGGFRGAP